jgi:hypothetical protein
MKRLEVIANQSVREDLIEGLSAAIPRFQYTVISPVQGAGARKKKLGDGVWPEENFILISYLEADAAQAARAFLVRLVERYPDEGIAFFELGD